MMKMPHEKSSFIKRVASDFGIRELRMLSGKLPPSKACGGRPLSPLVPFSRLLVLCLLLCLVCLLLAF